MRVSDLLSSSIATYSCLSRVYSSDSYIFIKIFYSFCYSVSIAKDPFNSSASFNAKSFLAYSSAFCYYFIAASSAFYL